MDEASRVDVLAVDDVVDDDVVDDDVEDHGEEEEFDSKVLAKVASLRSFSASIWLCSATYNSHRLAPSLVPKRVEDVVDDDDDEEDDDEDSDDGTANKACAGEEVGTIEVRVEDNEGGGVSP